MMAARETGDTRKARDDIRAYATGGQMGSGKMACATHSPMKYVWCPEWRHVEAGQTSHISPGDLSQLTHIRRLIQPLGNKAETSGWTQCAKTQRKQVRLPGSEDGAGQASRLVAARHDQSELTITFHE